MKEIKGKVVSYCDIPEELIPQWIEEYSPGSFIEVHISDVEGEFDELELWLMKNYPGIEEDTFYIEIDC